MSPIIALIVFGVALFFYVIALLLTHQSIAFYGGLTIAVLSFSVLPLLVGKRDQD